MGCLIEMYEALYQPVNFNRLQAVCDEIIQEIQETADEYPDWEFTMLTEGCDMVASIYQCVRQSNAHFGYDIELDLCTVHSLVSYATKTNHTDLPSAKRRSLFIITPKPTKDFNTCNVWNCVINLMAKDYHIVKIFPNV